MDETSFGIVEFQRMHIIGNGFGTGPGVKTGGLKNNREWLDVYRPWSRDRMGCGMEGGWAFKFWPCWLKYYKHMDFRCKFFPQRNSDASWIFFIKIFHDVPVTMLSTRYPLVNSHITIEHGPVEIVDKNPWKRVIFHSKILVYQRLPSGKLT